MPKHGVTQKRTKRHGNSLQENLQTINTKVIKDFVESANGVSEAFFFFWCYTRSIDVCNTRSKCPLLLFIMRQLTTKSKHVLRMHFFSLALPSACFMMAMFWPDVSFHRQKTKMSLKINSFKKNTLNYFRTKLNDLFQWSETLFFNWREASSLFYTELYLSQNTLKVVADFPRWFVSFFPTYMCTNWSSVQWPTNQAQRATGVG